MNGLSVPISIGEKQAEPLTRKGSDKWVQWQKSDSRGSVGKIAVVQVVDELVILSLTL